jgi:hypothetical protein
MPKRLVTCPVIGTGTKRDQYRAKVADYGIAFIAAMNNDPVTGAPTHTFTLAMIGAPTLAELQPAMNDPEVRVIPAARMDDPLSSFTVAQRNILRDAALQVGVDTSGYTGVTPLGTVIRDIGNAIQPGFVEDASHFDINVIPGG